jgi:hypothetical protein
MCIDDIRMRWEIDRLGKIENAGVRGKCIGALDDQDINNIGKYAYVTVSSCSGD